MILYSEYQNIQDVENLIDLSENYKRVTIFSNDEKEISNLTKKLSCDRININGFEDLSIKSFLNNIEFFGMDHISNIQSIVDLK